MKHILVLLFQNYFHHSVGKKAAALAYYLLFALFPILIFISNLIGMLELDIMEITHLLQSFIPYDVVKVIESYLEYVSQASSSTLLWFALIFAIFFPMRAIKGLMDDIRFAYHLDPPKNKFLYTLRQFIYTIILLFVIGITLILSTLNELPSFLPISDMILLFYQYLRFIPIIFFMFIALGTLYTFALDHRPTLKEVSPGIVFALIAWLLVSILFSFYVDNFANYSLIYGTLGAIIILMLWLYFTSIILIMGAELNAIIKKGLHLRNPHKSASGYRKR